MRVFWIVLDSAGIGNAPDAELFGDQGSNTWKRCFDTGKLEIPNMEKLGIYQINGMEYAKSLVKSKGCYGVMEEKSQGKDTTTGHWEMAGIISENPFPVYPNGFPKEIIEPFEKITGRKILCNKPYSGTEVLKDYGKEQVETGGLIVYTSADSVFQIAAHEHVVPVDTLYEYCRIARKILCGKHAVARVIARPFVGEAPEFIRTDKRHDFSLEPPKETILTRLRASGKDVIGVGKISDIFAGQGLTESIPNHGNDANMREVFSIQDREFDGLCYINLVDFDMLYGHRRDVEGYTEAFNRFDRQLGKFLSRMRTEDLVLITADHGCDPGYKGSDHTRERVPVLCYGAGLKENVNLGVRQTYADLAATIADLFQIEYRGAGKSFKEQILF